MLRLFLSTVFTIILLSADFAYAQSGQIEPNAGTWKTWVITSGKDFRVPPLPDATATAAELAQLRDLLAKNDPQVTGKIRFWDAGSPGYRWISIVNNRFAAGEKEIAFPHRLNAYLTMAIYDATIAAWESVTTSEFDPKRTSLGLSIEFRLDSCPRNSPEEI
jgi:hypothetical protein